MIKQATCKDSLQGRSKASRSEERSPDQQGSELQSGESLMVWIQCKCKNKAVLLGARLTEEVEESPKGYDQCRLVECALEAYEWAWSKKKMGQGLDWNLLRNDSLSGGQAPILIRREGDFKETIRQVKASGPALEKVEEHKVAMATFRVMITTCGLRVSGERDVVEWKTPQLKSNERRRIMARRARFHQPELDAALASIKQEENPSQQEVDQAHYEVKRVLEEQCAWYEELLARESWTGKGEIRLLRNKGGRPGVKAAPVSQPHMIRVQEKVPIRRDRRVR